MQIVVFQTIAQQLSGFIQELASDLLYFFYTHIFSSKKYAATLHPFHFFGKAVFYEKSHAVLQDKATIVRLS